MSYSHLTLSERGHVQALLREGRCPSYIATTLKRSVATICREIKRNRTQTGYDAMIAQDRYKQRRMGCRPGKKLEYLPLWNYVFGRLPEGWTPEQVAGRLPLDYAQDVRMRISHEALYQNLYANERLHCLIQYLPQARPKRRKQGQGKTRRGPSMPNRVGIEHRPKEVEERSRVGDWEGDTLVGANQQGFVATLSERTILMTLARKTETKQAEEVAQALTEALMDMPASWLKTLTLDNGTEFAKHEIIAQKLPIRVYFATPYSSYQRGTNENTNGLLRRYLPKGMDFRKLTQERLDQIVELLNNRPRKKLGYRTPNEVFQELRQKTRLALSP
jgi:transposase, IS30 family